MIQVEIIKWKKSAIYLVWTFVICIITAITIIILDEKVNELTKSIGLILVFPAFISIAIVKFMRKSNTIGNATFKKDAFVIETEKMKKELNYNQLEKLDFNNYNGQQYFSLKDIYPYNDGLNNYIWIKNENGTKKFELKIESRKIYVALEQHFDGLKKDNKTSSWKIKRI